MITSLGNATKWTSTRIPLCYQKVRTFSLWAWHLRKYRFSDLYWIYHSKFLIAGPRNLQFNNVLLEMSTSTPKNPKVHGYHLTWKLMISGLVWLGYHYPTWEPVCIGILTTLLASHEYGSRWLCGSPGNSCQAEGPTLMWDRGRNHLSCGHVSPGYPNKWSCCLSSGIRVYTTTKCFPLQKLTLSSQSPTNLAVWWCQWQWWQWQLHDSPWPLPSSARL